MIASDLSGLPRTLLFTLRARAEEHLRADRLLADETAVAWYNQITLTPTAREAMNAAYSPIFQLGTAVRARLYDEIVARFLAQHSQALIVELGAGLTTRNYRLATAQNHWVALDLPPAIMFRQRFEGVEATAVTHNDHIATSMLDPAWITQLPSFAPQHILFIAEGVLFFLPPEAISTLFSLLTTHFPGATFAFDALTQQFSRKALARLLAADAPVQWQIVDENDIAVFDLTKKQQWVITRVFGARWEALGFTRQQLLASKGNILFETLL